MNLIWEKQIINGNCFWVTQTLSGYLAIRSADGTLPADCVYMSSFGYTKYAAIAAASE